MVVLSHYFVSVLVIVSCYISNVHVLATTEAADPVLVSLADTDPTAVCLDGSPGSFFIKRNPKSTNWLMFFQVWLDYNHRVAYKQIFFTGRRLVLF